METKTENNGNASNLDRAIAKQELIDALTPYCAETQTDRNHAASR